MILKVDGGYRVYAESGKPLSKVLKTRGAAERRLKQVEYFRDRDKGKKPKK